MDRKVSWKDRKNEIFARMKRLESFDEEGSGVGNDKGPLPPSSVGNDQCMNCTAVSNASQKVTEDQHPNSKGSLKGAKLERRSRSTTASSVTYDKFQKKTCIYFCENTTKRKKGGESVCYCGRLESYHNSEALLNRNLGIKWDINKHVRKNVTNAYGEVEFYGCNRKTRAKFIRLSDDSNADNALKLLLKEWKLEYPKLLISVTGGAKTFKLPSKLKQQFREGLFKVAQTTGAWVITGGTNTGVMKHVGEALQVASNSIDEAKRKVYCIGIATWGIVEHRKQLRDHSMMQNSPVKYFVTNSVQLEGACLDNNHTHFFLVDNGTVNRYGAEIKFRAQLEKRIMKMDVDKNRGGVPAVLLVLEGGPNTILTVYEAISQDPAIPVVIIKDSGRAADLLAFTHNISQGEGPLYDMGDVVEHKQLLKRIEQTFPEMEQSSCLTVYSNLLKCVEKKHLITIFKMEEGGADIDQAILTALLKSKSTSPEEQLKLALIWNRADIARSEIFNDDLKWPLSSLEHAMKEALEKDRTEFVELLLEHGVNMRTFLTKDRLEGLYSVRSLRGKSIMKYFLGSDKCKSGAIRLRDIEEIFTRLTGLTTECELEKLNTNIVMQNMNLPAASKSVEYPFNELFVWAVLNNMQKMAICFWKQGEESMARALVACKLYLSMATYAEKRDLRDEIIESLHTNRNEFQELAVQLLNQCSLSNEKRSSKLLTYDLKNWGHSTCLTLAVSSEHEIFVAHSCCQQLLSDMWAGAMSFRTHQSLKTICCLFFPPMIVKLGFRSKTDIREMPQTEEQHEEYEREDREELDGNYVDQDNNDTGPIEASTSFDEVDFRRAAFKKSSTVSESQVSIISSGQKDAVTLRSSDSAVYNSLRWWEKLLEFYTAPITKFWANVISYLVFLCLYTYVVLGNFSEELERTEITLLIFVISLTTEELRQILQSDSNRLYKKFVEWSQSKWNWCDGIAIALFYIGFFLRLDKSTLSAGHVVLSIDIIFWIVRLLDIFSVNPHLGPYVVMIGRMTVDLMYFLFIMAVFLSAYGVARLAILYPSDGASWKSLANVFFAPYWQTYGELFIEKEHLYSSAKTYFGTPKYNSYSEPIVSLLMALYLLIANILLLNLLIAIFNNTFADVQANSNKIWKFQRYHLIMEYSRRPPLVPPLVILNHLWSLCKRIHRVCKRTRCCKKDGSDAHRTDRKMKFFPKPRELADLMQFEEECMAQYSRKKACLHLTSKGERIRTIFERVEDIWQAEEIKKETTIDKKQMQLRMNQLEDKLEMTSKNLAKEMANLFERYLENPQPRTSPTASKGFLQGRPARLSGRSSLPANIIASDAGEFRSQFGEDGKPMKPRRFLSHNPYLHMPAYEKTAFVKRAAWNFRKVSLRSESPSEKELEDALHEEGADTDLINGYDSVDAPVGKATQRFPSKENEPRLRRAVSCPQRSSFEGDSDDSEDTPNEMFDQMIGQDVNLESIEAEVYSDENAVIYPMSCVKRLPVPEHLAGWQVDYFDYNPPDYTSPTIRSDWADPETTESLRFNEMDGAIDRGSDYRDYDVVSGRPRNPFGRTGISGRGLLPRWGPNHAVEVIITRWKRSANGEKFQRGSELYCLECLSLERDNVQVIPSGLVSTKDDLPKIISDLCILKNPDSSKEGIIREFFKQGYEISRSNIDSRNTDNAWIESRVINFHDEKGNVAKHFNMENSKLSWKEFDIESMMNLKSKSHLIRICQMRGAHFCD